MTTQPLPPAPRLLPLESISIVAPACNEGTAVGAFHERLAAVMGGLQVRWEVVYVSDGSTDLTLFQLLALSRRDPAVTLVNLSRSFGKAVATIAGLDHARGEAVIVIGTDLQDPPELIPDLVKAWQEGYDVALAQCRPRSDSAASGWLTRVLGRVERPADGGDFRLMSRRVVEAVLTMREHHNSMTGVLAWVGFPCKAVPYDRDARQSGGSKRSRRKLVEATVEAATRFSLLPLKAATVASIVTALIAIASSIFILIDTVVFGIGVPGYPSLMIVVLLLGSAQLFLLGAIAGYLRRAPTESNRRPLYFVERVVAGGSLAGGPPLAAPEEPPPPGEA